MPSLASLPIQISPSPERLLFTGSFLPLSLGFLRRRKVRLALPKLPISELRHYRLELPEMVNSQFLLGSLNPQTRSSLRHGRVSKHFTSILVTDSCRR